MTKPEGLSDTGVPDIVTPDPPAEMLVSTIGKQSGWP